MNTAYNFALIGHRIAYSRSAAVFQAIFDVKGVKGRFEILDVAPPNFHSRLIELVKKGVQGLSVTIPYKKAVIQHLHSIDTIARALDAVNSIAIDSGRLSGFNTDCYGFSLPLQEHAERLKHGSALILGCGGAAKAAVYSLYTDYEVQRFTVAGRTEAKLSDFKSSLEKQIPNINIKTVSLTAKHGQRWRGQRYEIIVNCTPLGGWNYPDDSPLPDTFDWAKSKIFYDVNYNADNKLIRAAKDAGLTAIDGAAMLVGQAIRSFALWTNESVPFEPVFERVFGGASP
jgi:shikimate dehydrogenase